uniref:Putative isopenicillin-n-synthase n=1 Tax=Dryodora glandiformis TaxID=1566677 RepID=A0A0A0RX49_9METZ|nr:putative isopenicillin-n-synthase [Dryodora glandiformis]
MVAVQTNPLFSVPQLDYSEIASGEAREALIQVLQKYAFFYVVNIPGFDPKAELEAIKGFFEQPLDVKKKSASKKHTPDNSNILRGYGYTTNIEGSPIEEVFNVGQYESREVKKSQFSSTAEFISREPNKWPKEGECGPGSSSNFRDVISNGFQVRMRLARTLLEEIAAGVGFGDLPDKFKEAEFSSFYLKKYTERDNKDNEKIYAPEAGYQMRTKEGKVLSIPSHIDTTVTLLATYSNGGLQAEYDGEWHDVPSVMGSLLVMTGSLISELSDDQIPALVHRVIDIKRDRYSTPFFFNPSFNADISRSVSGKTTKTGAQFATFGPWQVTQLHRDEPLLLTSTSLATVPSNHSS